VLEVEPVSGGSVADDDGIVELDGVVDDDDDGVVAELLTVVDGSVVVDDPGSESVGSVDDVGLGPTRV
jgi:hypothetical protein